MFEKEAEDNKPPYACCALDTNCELWKDGFKKGAELGYNDGKAETTLLSKHILELQTTNGALTDRVNEATEIIREYINILKGDTKNWKKTQKKAEAFINKE